MVSRRWLPMSGAAGGTRCHGPEVRPFRRPSRRRGVHVACVESCGDKGPPKTALRRGNGEALAALLAARSEHLAAALGLHPRAEAVRLLPMAVAGTVRALHGDEIL